MPLFADGCCICSLSRELAHLHLAEYKFLVFVIIMSFCLEVLQIEKVFNASFLNDLSKHEIILLVNA